MSYYMRFVSTDKQAITTGDIRDVFTAAGAEYEVQIDDAVATVHHSGATLAQVEINMPGDGLFDEERDELIEFARDSDGDGPATARVLKTLAEARSIVAVQVLFGTGDSDTTLERLDPLWTWFFRNRQGLMQADGEGYYDASGVVLGVD